MPYKDIKDRRAAERRYRERNAEAVKKYQREYAKTHRPAARLANERWKLRNWETWLWYRARNRARQMGRVFMIEPSDIVIPDKCPWLGVKLSKTGPKDRRPSVDRVDNRFGYIPGNIEVISWRANRLKQDAALEELATIGKRAVKLLRGKS